MVFCPVFDRNPNGSLEIEELTEAVGIASCPFPNTQTGASALWVALAGAPCDLIAHLGMLAGTDAAHLNPTFQIFPYQPPEPEPGPYDAAADALETIARGYQDLSYGYQDLATVLRRLG